MWSFATLLVHLTEDSPSYISGGAPLLSMDRIVEGSLLPTPNITKALERWSQWQLRHSSEHSSDQTRDD